MQLPPFEKFTKILNDAGVKTGSGRESLGGVTDDGAIVLTTFIDRGRAADGSWRVWRPKTDHGGLRSQWEIGAITVGTHVRLILARPIKQHEGPPAVKDACLLSETYVIKSVAKDGLTAQVVPA